MPNESGQLTEKQLGLAYWYVTHKLQLKKIGIGLLIAFDMLTVGFGLWGLLDFYLISWNKDLTLRRDLGRTLISHETVNRLGPVSLNIPSVDIFNAGSGRFDFLAKLENPNENWYATFRYRFLAGTEETPEREGFILPAEEKFVGAFAVETASLPRRAEFRLTELAWHRVDRHVIRDYAAWSRERLNFILGNITHTSTLKIDSIIGRTSFDIENRSAFGYWRVGLPVVLLRGTAPAAVSYTTLDNLEAGEKRHVDINWFETLPATSSVDIRPEVNIFDSNVYLPPRVQ